MRKTLAAAAALVALGTGTPILTAAVAAPASACTVSYHGITGLGEPGYASVHMVTDACGVPYHAKALCKSTPTSGVTVYGPQRTAPGYSRADCPGQDRVAAAWAVINGVSYQYYG